MMLNLTRKTVLASAFLLSTLSSVFAGFPEEKELIDKHSPATFKTQITDVVKFTLDAIDERKDPRFQKALVHLGLKPANPGPEVPESYEYNVIVGGLYLLNKFAQKEDPTGVDVLEAGEVASTLLSPEIFPNDYAYDYKYGIYDVVLKRKKTLCLAGLYQQERIPADLVDDIREVLEENPSSRHLNTISAKFFDPVILTGENSVFTDEGYVYGLSKKKLLHGLPKEQQWVHGGIIKNPSEVYLHDQGHNNDILGVDDTKPEEVTAAVANVVQTLAGRFYSLIYDETLFQPEEREKAFRAASYFFHENQIEKSGETLLIDSIFQNPLRKQFDTILRRFDMTFQSYFQVCNSPKPPSTMTETERFMQQMLAQSSKEEPLERNPFYFHERFASDTAKQICGVYPEAEVEIFGTETDTDRNYLYHGPNALKWNLQLMKWFADKVRDRL